MTLTAAEILANALEEDANKHASGQLEHIERRILEVQREIVAINNIPRPIYKLAIRFWKEWARAQQVQWRYEDSISKDDWPVMARTIAKHVRIGTLPNDKNIINHFVRRRRRLSWRDLKRLFGKSD